MSVSNPGRAIVAFALLLTLSFSALAEDNRFAGEMHGAPQRGYTFDKRYNHNQFYPGRGYNVRQLPPGAFAVRGGGGQYYYRGGAWYRPYGGGFVVIAPPIGLMIPVLPPLYTTVWFGGIPYYYADDTYYTWSADQQGYVVSDPPQDSNAVSTAPPMSEDLFIYPKNGQSQDQQAKDQYECHSWARQQSGYDPTLPLGGVSADQTDQARAAYQRAEGACLESRGYTAK